MEAKHVFALISVIIIGIIIYLQITITPIPEVCIQETCYSVELALTPQEKTLGLMHRTTLKQQTGMLFIYNEENKHPFWMKNTLIPLDMIYINKEKKIVYIEHSAPPCTKDPCQTYGEAYESQTVLELPGGSAKTHLINIGDTVTYNNILQYNKKIKQ